MKVMSQHRLKNSQSAALSDATIFIVALIETLVIMNKKLSQNQDSKIVLETSQNGS
jgi:hypothetical protein